MEPTPYTKYEDWPNNYVEEVVQRAADTDLVLITTNPEVIQSLRGKGLPVTVVCPYESLKEECQQRYIDRGNSLRLSKGSWRTLTSLTKRFSLTSKVVMWCSCNQVSTCLML